MPRYPVTFGVPRLTATLVFSSQRTDLLSKLSLAIQEHELTRRDWDRRFGGWSAILAGIATCGSLAFGYHALWAAFFLLIPLYVLLRFSTPVGGYRSPVISRWSLLLVPILFVVIPALLALSRYVASSVLR
ncbi:hypothetical protein [Allorhodopirellula heiligendammensis]|uniref:Uncharacterized protein n=1 Tax=Allorhodopirellula heiligendammensis TaxID=2714739 RepID=A0A5C6BDS6_9BACT|nr:hypothetical protein [Allorhodopirellula heiligendammensis]TWU08584.1 hypothetical protein Poly21_55530 [Allorhodopirellula heiligendammensis]